MNAKVYWLTVIIQSAEHVQKNFQPFKTLSCITHTYDSKTWLIKNSTISDILNLSLNLCPKDKKIHPNLPEYFENLHNS